jgi:hypothetical protein
LKFSVGNNQNFDTGIITEQIRQNVTGGSANGNSCLKGGVLSNEGSNKGYDLAALPCLLVVYPALEGEMGISKKSPIII